MKKYLLFTFLPILFLFSCNQEEAEPTISAEAEAYLDEILDIMQRNSINRKNIDWADFSNKVFEKAGAAQSIDDTYIGIREALTLLDDNHSFFRQPNGRTFSAFNATGCQAGSNSTPAIPENIGYVKVNWFSGATNDDKAIAFAQEIQDQIKAEDQADLQGWIVDLRGNTGGNMWPMLAGIGPILGEGIAGYFIDPDDRQSYWGYSFGGSFINSFRQTTLTNFYELMNADPKVAVLLDQAVASSGEAVAIAFIDRANTRSFGTSTCGLSTANSSFNLSNSATLYLTVSYMADRNKKLYGIPIEPAEEVNSEDVVEKAIDWINQ